MSKKETILDWLRRNEEIVSVRKIAALAGISQTQLAKAIKGQHDGHGTLVKIPDKYLPNLEKIIDDLKRK